MANSVVNGINPVPSQFTGGEGPVTGQEVLFDVTHEGSFNAAFSLDGTIPEPASLALLALGLAGMAAARRKLG